MKRTGWELLVLLGFGWAAVDAGAAERVVPRVVQPKEIRDTPREAAAPTAARTAKSGAAASSGAPAARDGARSTNQVSPSGEQKTAFNPYWGYPGYSVCRPVCVPACRPAYGVPGYGGYGAPMYGVPAYGSPAYGVPGYGMPAYGVPNYGVPGYGAPAPISVPGYVNPGFVPVSGGSVYPGMPLNTRPYVQPGFDFDDPFFP
jgi:hypothetical protein